MKYVYVDESPYNPGKYLIFFESGMKPFTPCTGCREILGARLLGLSYANFLRYCRDVYGAEIHGKNYIYPTPYFPSRAAAEKLAKIFDQRLQLLLQ